MLLYCDGIEVILFIYACVLLLNSHIFEWVPDEVLSLDTNGSL